MAHWGDVQYRDRNKVPMRRDRCTSQAAEEADDPGHHVCKLHTLHEGDHKCLCGKEWVTENA